MFQITRKQEIRPQDIPVGAAVSGICLSPDLEKIAYIAGFGKGSDPASAICIEPVKGNWHGTARIGTKNGMSSDLRWSPDGSHLAYCLHDSGTTPSTPAGIGWIADIGNGQGTTERGGSRIPGMNYAWMPEHDELVVASSAFLRIIGIRTGCEAKIADLNDDGDPLFPPQITISPDGNRIAYTTRRTDENISRLWVANRDRKDWDNMLLVYIPGAFVFLSPFWSQDSTTLGLHTVHPKTEKSRIIIFPDLAGDGKVVYENDLLNPGHEPSFCPSGDGIFFYHTPQPRTLHGKTGPAQLAFLSLSGNLHSSGLHALSKPSEKSGMLRLRCSEDSQLVIDGADKACLLSIQSVDKK
jgi:dipeptidyl aminopeptidase/acylaminoacyl peptidase